MKSSKQLREKIQCLEEKEALIDLATSNLKIFLKDLDIANLHYAVDGSLDGSFFSGYDYVTFILGFDQQPEPLVYISMPAAPINVVRCRVGTRVYVDGSSWYWSLALESAKRCLFPESNNE